MHERSCYYSNKSLSNLCNFLVCDEYEIVYNRYAYLYIYYQDENE